MNELLESIIKRDPAAKSKLIIIDEVHKLRRDNKINSINTIINFICGLIKRI